MASWSSTVRVIRMLRTATAAIRISSPTAMPKILIPMVTRMLGSNRHRRGRSLLAGRSNPWWLIAVQRDRARTALPAIHRDQDPAALSCALDPIEAPIRIRYGAARHRRRLLAERHGIDQ